MAPQAIGYVVLEHAVAQPDNTVGLIFVDGGFMSLQSREGVTWEEMAERMHKDQHFASEEWDAWFERSVQEIHKRLHGAEGYLHDDDSGDDA